MKRRNYLLAENQKLDSLKTRVSNMQTVNINIDNHSPKDALQSYSSRKDIAKNSPLGAKPKNAGSSPVNASSELCSTLDLHQPKSWEFQNFSTDPSRPKKRPHEEPSPSDRPKRRSPHPTQSPDTTPHTSFIMVAENNPCGQPLGSAGGHGKAGEMEMLYQEIRKLKNQNMAMKWENGELKCENTRYKMYNQELAAAHQVLAKEKEKVKQDLEGRIEKLESEKKVLQGLVDKLPKNVAPWDHFTPTPDTQSASWHPIKKHPNQSAISNLID
eukprot:TRINITY_DN22320_c0_g1_i1.p1 TRINITY_DN22320_c0_g1~~TRINITY_DN22320_c0_g1_i1.p1  ORF type:complete len:271 (-),score=61.76 TRINITY_DN22320_c0_g1_i1:81-893(-)